jgi:NAD(P)-dependent dehydrogenase (short-subunit alcohol dehydrogenase family)
VTDRFSLAGLNALVIGGTSGIGLAIARGYRDAGAEVSIVGRNPEKLEQARAELGLAARGRAFQADVSEVSRLTELVAQVLAIHGRVDVLVNCQGVTNIKPAIEFTPADYHEIMSTNAKSVFFACTQFGREMLARERGAIVNIASLASYRGWQRSAVYAMSKAAVVSLTETLAAEWAERGVRVNAIAPGVFMTELNRTRMSEERKALAIARTPMRRFGELEELVGAAIYLASPAASFVTGETIRVDGGFLAAGLG